MLIKIADDLLEGTRIRSPMPPRSEWLFQKAGVSDEELVACVCWEYLREVRPEDFDGEGLKQYAQHLLVSYRSLKARRQFSDSFDRIPLRILFFLAEHPGQPFPLQPWQELNERLRHELNKPLAFGWNPLIEMKATATGLTSWELTIPAPNVSSLPRSWAEQAPQLYAYAVAHEARYLSSDPPENSLPGAIEVQRTPGFDGEGVSTHDPRQWLITYAANGFATPAPFLINWGEYTQEEIVQAFKTWVKRVHPGFAPVERRRGTRTSDLGGALRDLGACRIMQAMPEQEFTGWHKDEYGLFAQPRNRKRHARQLPELDLIKMRSRAVKFFRTYFALDPNAKPQSWVPPRSNCLSE